MLKIAQGRTQQLGDAAPTPAGGARACGGIHDDEAAEGVMGGHVGAHYQWEFTTAMIKADSYKQGP
jgi:hypothetical protein